MIIEYIWLSLCILLFIYFLFIYLNYCFCFLNDVYVLHVSGKWDEQFLPIEKHFSFLSLFIFAKLTKLNTQSFSLLFK